MKRFWLEPVWEEFVARATRERLAHAILLCGPEGTGKREMADHMMAWLLCASPGDSACGSCRSCRLLAGGAHPDRFVAEPEEGKAQIRIGETERDEGSIRHLIASLTLTTTVSRRKVALVHPAEAMNKNSANAILKTLEEPPGDAVIVLVSHDPGRLPATVRSRCQALTVRLPEREAARRWLGETAGVAEDRAELALAAAGGAPLAAARLLESGEIEGFEALRAALSRLRAEPGAASGFARELAQAEEKARLWGWVSLCTAEALRDALTGRTGGWLEGARRPAAASLAALQSRADENRRLTRAAALRQDLLLEDWLLEWARSP